MPQVTLAEIEEWLAELARVASTNAEQVKFAQASQTISQVREWLVEYAAYKLVGYETTKAQLIQNVVGETQYSDDAKAEMNARYGKNGEAEFIRRMKEDIANQPRPWWNMKRTMIVISAFVVSAFAYWLVLFADKLK